MQLLKKLKSQFFDMRKGEGGIALAMALFFFLVITAYYIIKPVRNALFLESLGAEMLPWVYIGTAVVIGFFVSVYARFVGRLPRHLLIAGSTGFLISNLVGFWWLLRFDWAWIPFAFYIWVNIFSVMVVTEFWIFVNGYFTPPEAKRLFGFIGTGGIIGGAAGGFITQQLVSVVGTERLLLISGAILGICIVLVVWIHNRYSHRTAAREEQRSRRRPAWEGGKALSLIRQSPHLRLQMGIVLLMVIVSTFVDYQFNSIAEVAFPTKEAKTAFFGTFFGSLNVVSFVVQFFLTTYLLRRFGLGLTLFLLPISLLMGSLAVAVAPVLWAGVLVKMSDGSLRYSVDQSTREILYLPLPTRLVHKTKPFIDMAGYRFAKGVGGALLLTVPLLGLDLRTVSLGSASIIAVWIGVAVAMRREYLRSLWRNLARGFIRAEELSIDPREASTVSTLVQTLREGTDRQILYALKMLEDVPKGPILDDLRRLIQHESDQIRAQALKMLYELREEDLLPQAKAMLDDRSLEVRLEAIRYVCDLGREDPMETMGRFLRHEDPGIRAAAATCVLLRQLEGAPVTDAAASVLREMVAAPDREARLQVARALAWIPVGVDGLHQALFELWEDQDMAVRQAALRSAGQLGRREFVPGLVERLGEREVQRAAREALAAYGGMVEGTLLDHLRDPAVDLVVRKRIPDVFSLIRSDRAVDSLLDALDEEDPGLRYKVIKGLNKIRKEEPYLDIDPERIKQQIHREAHEYYRTLVLFASYMEKGGGGGPRCRIGDLLCEALQERLDFTVERISRLLGLIYRPADIYFAYRGLRSDDPSRRASAHEYLDNLLSGNLKRLLLPIWDEMSYEDRVSRALELSGHEKKSLEEVLRVLLESGDRWLAVCAIHTVGDLGLTIFRDGISRQCAERDELIRETADLALQRLNGAGEGGDVTERELSVVEKAVILSGVELFSEVTTEQLSTLASIATEEAFREGETIFREGDPGDALFVLREGEVEIRKGESLVHVCSPGESFGTWAILHRKPRLATAVARTKANSLVIDAEEFSDLLADEIEIAHGIFKVLTSQIEELLEAKSRPEDSA